MPFDLVARESVEGLLKHRAEALERFREIHVLNKQAIVAAVASAPMGRFGLPQRYRGHPFLDLPSNEDEWMTLVRKELDKAFWRSVMEMGQFEKLMDHTAREKFRKAMEQDDPPEPTVENCFATLESLVADSGMMFRRGVAVAFSNLDRRFKTHDGFKIGSKVILTSLMSPYGTGINHGGRSVEHLRDVERVFYLLDEKPVPENWAGNIGAKINAAESGFHPTSAEVEDEYFRVVFYKNRNGHLYFKRPDLVRKVNKVLAEYYGEALGSCQVDDSPTFDVTRMAKNFGYFPTPPEVSKRILDDCYLEPGMKVLEPSAGDGALIRALRERCDGLEIHAIELQEQFRDQLRPLAQRVTIGNFLTEDPEPIYDRIVMNPPFDRGMDVAHVQHARKFLKPGGLLIAIMSAGVEFREDRATKQFRDSFNLGRYSGNPFWSLPMGSFESVGTGVATVYVRISV